MKNKSAEDFFDEKHPELKYANDSVGVKRCIELMEEYGTQKARLAIEAAGKIAKQINERETQSVTNEGASTATLEELEKLVKAEREQQCITFGPEGDKRRDPITEFGFNTCWDLVKPHLSELLKEKDENIDLLYEESRKQILELRYKRDELQQQIQELQSQLKEKEETIAKLNKINAGIKKAENERQ